MAYTRPGMFTPQRLQTLARQGQRQPNASAYGPRAPAFVGNNRDLASPGLQVSRQATAGRIRPPVFARPSNPQPRTNQQIASQALANANARARGINARRQMSAVQKPMPVAQPQPMPVAQPQPTQEPVYTSAPRAPYPYRR